MPDWLLAGRAAGAKAMPVADASCLSSIASSCSTDAHASQCVKSNSRTLAHRGLISLDTLAETARSERGRSASSRLTPWSDERAENPDGQQELQVRRETPRAVPAEAVVKELPAARTQEGEDVLEVGGGTRRGAKRRRIEWASPRGEEKDACDAAAISRRRERKSWCGRRSPARWRIGPRRSAASRDLLAAPAAAPVATWSATITAALPSRLRARRGYPTSARSPRQHRVRQFEPLAKLQLPLGHAAPDVGSGLPAALPATIRDEGRAPCPPCTSPDFRSPAPTFSSSPVSSTIRVWPNGSKPRTATAPEFLALDVPHAKDDHVGTGRSTVEGARRAPRRAPSGAHVAAATGAVRPRRSNA